MELWPIFTPNILLLGHQIVGTVEHNKKEKEEIYSRRVRAGKRTYFFDIKSTRSDDYYLTITESKKRFKDDGFYYEKHKIFLYKEDFVKFVEALNDCVDYVKEELMPDYDFERADEGYDDDEAYEEEYESNAPSKKLDTELSWE